MEGALCLVEVNPSGGLLLHVEALQILQSLDNAVEVVAIFGPKDTGKSFLMNQIPGMSDGFRLSTSSRTKTPGIWMKCLPHPMRRHCSLVLLDTEGFGEEEDQNTFAMLFLLDVLTCSVFIYNTRASLEIQEELTHLKYMSEVSGMVCVDADLPDDTTLLLQGVLPEFICCMRDATPDLQMEKQMLDTGHSLDAALCQGEDVDWEVPPVGYQLFPRRKLFHFCHPCSDGRDQDLETLPQSQLDPYFQGQASRFWDYALGRKAKTTLGNREVNGRILAGFLERYVEFLMQDKVIVLSDLCDLFEEDIGAFQEVVSKECSEAEEVKKPWSDVRQSTVFTPSPSWTREDPQSVYEPNVADLKYWEEEEVESPRRSDFQHCPAFAPSPSRIREVPQSSFEPKRETVFLDQSSASASSAWSSPIRFQDSSRQSKTAVPTMDEPMCLIENMPGGSLQVKRDAMNILGAISQPVVVVAIVGMYRTGKSYLMNKLARKQTGFSLGSTIQSHTKGIWMWCVPHPNKPNHTLVLLDTEGLGDVEKGDSKNDSWIFALAVLLSSTFVYNSMGTIDYHALEQLHYVTELTERIKVKSAPSGGGGDDADSEFMSFFPAFVWTVRDFTLDLKADGRAITDDEYLEHALKLSPDADAKSNMPKQYIRRYFPSRNCFVFDRPTNKKNLGIIETLKEDQLEPDFVEKAHKFCRHIFDHANAKTIKGGHIVTGTLLGNLAVTYVDAIRSGNIPCMENAVLALAEIENSAAVQEALECYVKGMEQGAQDFPTETLKEFTFLHTTCEKETLQVFLERSFKDDDQRFLRDLAHKVEAKCNDFKQRNDQASSDRCLALLLEDQEDIEEQMSQRFYAKPGGYQLYRDDQRKMVDKYNFMTGKGLKAGQVLDEVLKSQETTAQTILQMDSTLTQMEKEAAEERARSEALEREARVKQEMYEQTQQMMADQQRAHEAHTQQLQQKMEEERRKLLQEQEMLVSRKMQEQQRLLQEGFNKESARLGAEIQRLQGMIPRPRSPPRRRCTIS